CPPVLPLVCLPRLEPLPRSDVRLEVDHSAGRVAAGGPDQAVAVQVIKLAREQTPAHLAEPDGDRVPDLRVLLAGRPAELPLVGELLDPGALAEGQRPRLSRVAE